MEGRIGCTVALASSLWLVGCTMIAPQEEFRRANASYPDLANAQQLANESIRVGRDCHYRLFGIIPVYRLSPEVNRARADVYPPPSYASKTEAVYFRKTYKLLGTSECWEVWTRFEGVQ